MKAKDRIGRTAKIIQKFTGKEEALCYQIAERIYADVLAPAIDEEMDRWLMCAYSDYDPDKLDS
jgi:hypothetical protein